ncbi:MAG: DNA repair protein RecO [Gammaproteobacteria bacterium]
MKQQRGYLCQAYVLHTRAYRNSSLIVELFSRDFGRVTVVAKGAKQLRSPVRGLMQPFMPLLLSWTGKHELMTLCSAENNGSPYYLSGLNLLSGLYLNELLLRTMQPADAYPNVYDHYVQVLQVLHAPRKCSNEQVLRSLRIFEKMLLSELGYGLQLEYEALSTEPIRDELFYRFEPGTGFIKTDCQDQHNYLVVMGSSINELAQNSLSTMCALRDSKRILRTALQTLLGNTPLKTRQLLEEMYIPIKPFNPNVDKNMSMYVVNNKA